MEEVEIATNVKHIPLYIADRRDEIEFLCWTVTIIKSILDRDSDLEIHSLPLLNYILA